MMFFDCLADVFCVFFENGLYFLPFIFLRLLIQSVKHEKDLDEKQARRIALWNSIIATAIACMYHCVECLISGVASDLLFVAEVLSVPILHSIPFYWIGLTILTKGSLLTEKMENGPTERQSEMVENDKTEVQ